MAKWPAVLEVAAVFDEAYAAHRAGRLADAERGYLATLARSPAHADALHMLGVLRLQQKRPAEAADLISRALARRPGFAGAHLNLGLAMRALGRPDEAIAAFQAAVAIAPKLGAAHFNLGNALAAAGRLADAAAALERAVALTPAHAGALLNLGNAYAALGLHEAALDTARRALRLHPAHPGAHNNAGLALMALSRADEALVHFTAALRAQPDFPLTLLNQGHALVALGRHEAALGPLENLVALQPGLAAAHLELGLALAGLDRFAPAREHLQRALAIDPELATAAHELGVLEYEAANLPAAARAFDRALALRADFPAARYNRALVALAQGDYARGLPGYEARFETLAAARAFAAPAWTGATLPPGASLLLHAEQGFGDTIQFLRYVPLLAGRRLRIFLEVQPALRRLVEASAAHWGDGVTVIERGAALPEVNWQCALGSLPLAMGTRADTIPATTPYLSAPPGAPRAPGGALSVGLVWSGSLQGPRDRRPVPVQALAPLFALDGVQWTSLHPAPPAADAHALAAFASVAAATRTLADFADTAAVIAGLDAVVTIDTAVAHLAGALARPTWIMLPFAADWRWGASGERSAWYPHARLVRQCAPGRWADVVARIARSIAALRDSAQR
jgi:tetratricopeptide (TPR) repeat protein